MVVIRKKINPSYESEISSSGNNTVPPISRDMKKFPISDQDLHSFKDEFDGDSKNQLASRALIRDSYSSVLENRNVALSLPAVFNNTLKLEGKITNQKSSGRCWIFAGLNVLRLKVMEKYNLDTFEISQTYLFFYDKIERSNWFLQNVINTIDSDLESREVQFLLSDPVGDGGQWDMFVSLINKYGVVPISVFPDSFHSTNSRQMNTLITTKLRTFARDIRRSYARYSSIEKVIDIRNSALSEIYRILSISLGEPPKSFDWTFYDKDKKYREYKSLTPIEFFNTHVGVNLSKTVSLINDPRNAYYKLYTVKYLGNVVGGDPIKYINLPSKVLKDLASSAISQKSKPVWFGCHVSKHINKSSTILDLDIIDYKSGLGVQFGLNKAERLEYGDSLMTHAMVFTGVQMENNSTEKWRVENSWGEDSGNKGFITMSDDWFSEYVYQIVLDYSDIPQDILDVLNQDSIVLPPWDPMGALAE
ncbi:Bleomycin hydrolase [Smittium mucronatum]|uniref:Cysteine proteinase 1, mitochondrial n=1 Tax=Smittium mucronatum TaxID=133383 RepID=A0A1R0GYR6_9FUNG|nr:Bleomycin hydrolase [Smittium mucronatum]